MKHNQAQTSDNLTDEEIETINTILHYPSLENVFDQEQQNLTEKRQNMLSTVAELERVVRRGSKAEAEKATRIIEAFQTTLNFLDELEKMRENQSA